MSITVSRIAKKLVLLGILAASVAIMPSDARGGACPGGSSPACDAICVENFQECHLTCTELGHTNCGICDRTRIGCQSRCRLNCPR